MLYLQDNADIAEAMEASQDIEVDDNDSISAVARLSGSEEVHYVVV